MTASGGYSWPRIVVHDEDATLFNYAVAGAACSTDIIYRYFPPIHGPLPGVINDEIPAFEADLDTGAYDELTADNTVYALWIGANDLGHHAFLTDSQAPGTTLSDLLRCMWDVFDRIYAGGGRRFVLLNVVPLEHAPEYAAEAGLDSRYWPDHRRYNMTEYEHKIREYTSSVNTMADYGVAFELLVKQRWPGARFSVFDVNRLLRAVYEAPESYLREPVDAKGVYRRCEPLDADECEDSEESKDSFMW